MRYEPIENRVLIEPVERDDITQTGVWVPNLKVGRPQVGKVLAIGIGRVTQNGIFVPCRLKPGDLVLFSRYGGTEVSHNFEKDLLIFMRETDILARILEDDEDE